MQSSSTSQNQFSISSILQGILASENKSSGESDSNTLISGRKEVENAEKKSQAILKLKEKCERMSSMSSKNSDVLKGNLNHSAHTPPNPFTSHAQSSVNLGGNQTSFRLPELKPAPHMAELLAVRNKNFLKTVHNASLAHSISNSLNPSFSHSLNSPDTNNISNTLASISNPHNLSLTTSLNNLIDPSLHNPLHASYDKALKSTLNNPLNTSLGDLLDKSHSRPPPPYNFPIDNQAMRTENIHESTRRNNFNGENNEHYNLDSNNKNNSYLEQGSAVSNKVNIDQLQHNKNSLNLKEKIMNQVGKGGLTKPTSGRMRYVEGVSPKCFECPQCRKKFAELRYVKRHMKRIHGTSFSHAKYPPRGMGFNKKKSNQLCMVCGDDAEGYSYGVITCYSCRIFFCVTSEVKDLKCNFDNKCVITKTTRISCR